MLPGDVVVSAVYGALAVSEKAFNGVGRDKGAGINPGIFLSLVIDGRVGSELLTNLSRRPATRQCSGGHPEQRGHAKPA